MQKHFWLPWKLVSGVTSLCLLPLLIINAAAPFPWSQIDLLYFLATRHIIWQLFTLICIFHLLSPHITCNNVNPRLLLGIWVAYYLLCSVSLPASASSRLGGLCQGGWWLEDAPGCRRAPQRGLQGISATESPGKWAQAHRCCRIHLTEKALGPFCGLWDVAPQEAEWVLDA